jgi:diguanylate cyclase (GGDEF)-like protein
LETDREVILDLAALLRRRRLPGGFRQTPVDRHRLDAVLAAGAALPLTSSAGCRAVAIEAPGLRDALVASLQEEDGDAAALPVLRTAPVLIALCDDGEAAAAPQVALVAAAQMALAAEDEGLATLLLPLARPLAPGRTLPPLRGTRLHALLAIGSDQAAGAEPRGEITTAPGVEAFLAADPPPRHRVDRGAEQGDDRHLLTSFLEIASASAAADDLDGVLERIAHALGRLFPVDGAALGLREDGAVLVREILRRGDAVRREPERLPDDATHLLGWVIAQQRPLWRNDVASEMRFEESLRGGGMRSDMTILLRARRRIIGAFRVACRRRHAFDPEDFETFQRCADLTAVAVETQRLLTATRRLSETDGLTGICNHRRFQQLLEQEVERAARARADLALLMIDIDDFKRINDTYGHPVGDEALRHVALLVSRSLRRSDVIARYGGEEFAAILPEATLQTGVQVAEAIRSEIERTPLAIAAPPGGLAVRVSLGVAALGSYPATPADLVAAADQALYQAKRTGKNRVCHTTVT